MGLFVKKNEMGTNAPLYTTGANKTIIVVGLGNVGKDYQGTRHNIGFACLDYYAEQQNFAPWVTKKDLKAQVTISNIAGTRTVLVKPTTFMNLSGDAVQAVAHFYKVSSTDILVVHDELAIEFNKIRTSIDGSAAGHNGIKSIIATLGEQFGRVRIGVGPKKPAALDSADFVLATFTVTQQKSMPYIVKEVASIISDFSASGSLYVETRSVLAL
jgi:PTH1 family peptidyl-tRNA hydrolase